MEIDIESEMLKFILSIASITMQSWQKYKEDRDIEVQYESKRLIIPYMLCPSSSDTWDKCISLLSVASKMQIITKLIQAEIMTKEIANDLDISPAALRQLIIQHDADNLIPLVLDEPEQLLASVIKANAKKCFQYLLDNINIASI